MALHVVWDFSLRQNVRGGALVLRSLQDWLRHAKQIEKAAMHKGDILTVVVFDQSLARYLEGYKATYPANVTEEDMNTVAQLARQEGPLPDGIDEEIITSAGLLQHPRPRGLAVEDWILSRLFDTDVFGQTALDPEREMELLCVLGSESSLLEKVFVSRAVRNKLNVWARHGSGVIVCLSRHGPLVARWLLINRVLGSYPETVLQQALGDRELVPQVPSEHPSDLSGLPLPELLDVPHFVVDRLETTVHATLKSLPLTSYLSTVSGILKIELDVLAGRLKDSVDAMPLDQIRQKFEPLLQAGQGESLRELENLWALNRGLVFPSVEGSAVESWTHIREFFKKHYLPAWRATHSAQVDPSINERVCEVDEAYTEWLLTNYFELSLSDESPLADRMVLRRIQRLRDEGVTVIWLVLDGARWETIQNRVPPVVHMWGWQVIAEETIISALPSITDVAMLSLVALSPLETIYPESESGVWKRVKRQSRKDRETIFRSQFPDGVYRSIRNGGDAIDALAKDSDIFCLIYGEIDELLHKKSDAALFEKYEQSAVEDLIRWVYEAINETGANIRASEGVSLLVTSDHGWTDVYRDDPIGIPSYLTQEGLVEPSHNRVLVMQSDHISEEIKSAIDPDWYLLSGPGVRLPKQLMFLLPKRLTPITRQGGRLHGGASMAETIVALVEVAVTQPSWLPLTTQLDGGNLVAGLPGYVTLTVKNPNRNDIPKALVRIEGLQILEEVGPIAKGRTEAFELSFVPQRSGNYTTGGTIEYKTPAANRRDRFSANVVIQPSEEERLAGRHLADTLFDER